MGHSVKHRRKRKQRRPISTAEQPTALEQGRLNRYIARAGVCSRRAADKLIERGLVKVNGNVVREYWHKVQPGDAVEANGRLISPRPFVYLLLNKPKNIIVTTRDERSRRTVMDLVPDEFRKGLFSVGRLDRDTVGVLLLTNDGTLGHRLMHPRYEVPKRYVVRSNAPLSSADLAQLRAGVALEDGLARADKVVLADSDDPCKFGLELHQGRNRQVRRMVEALGYEVVALERISYAGLTAKGVRRGHCRRLQAKEVTRLQRLVGRR